MQVIEKCVAIMKITFKVSEGFLHKSCKTLVYTFHDDLFLYTCQKKPFVTVKLRSVVGISPCHTPHLNNTR